MLSHIHAKLIAGQPRRPVALNLSDVFSGIVERAESASISEFLRGAMRSARSLLNLQDESAIVCWCFHCCSTSGSSWGPAVSLLSCESYDAVVVPAAEEQGRMGLLDRFGFNNAVLHIVEFAREGDALLRPGFCQEL